MCKDIVKKVNPLHEDILTPRTPRSFFKLCPILQCASNQKCYLFIITFIFVFISSPFEGKCVCMQMMLEPIVNQTKTKVMGDDALCAMGVKYSNRHCPHGIGTLTIAKPNFLILFFRS